MARKAVSSIQKHKLLYESGYACAVCQARGAHIHHIDENNANSAEENLVVLCTTHHDEAHTKHQLSQNLTADALRDAKYKWTAKVGQTRDLHATAAGQLLLAGNSPFASMAISWGYINHRRVAQLVRIDSLSPKEISYLEYCQRKGIVDAQGILIKPKGIASTGSYIDSSIYDWFEHGDDQRLHWLYSAFVDQISRRARPTHVEKGTWTSTRIQKLIKQGDFLIANRAFYFKCVRETPDNHHIRVHASSRGVSMEFFVDTRNMFGTTSMTVSFNGYKSCAAFLQLKSINAHDDGNMTLDCTPIALGVGFDKDWDTPAGHTP